MQRDNESSNLWLENDKVDDFTEFKSHIVKKNFNDHGFYVHIAADFVLFYKLSCIECPKITVSFKICNDFSLQFWNENIAFPSKQFEWLLGKNLKLERWSELDSIINHMNSFAIKSLSVNEIIEMCSQQIAQCADRMIDDEEEGKKAEALQFLSEQMHLLTQKRRRYSPQTIIWAYSLFLRDTSAYSRLRRTDILCLPHAGYLKRLSITLGTEKSGIQNSHVKYLSQKAALQSSTEKLVNLMLDEIYVNSQLTYKSGSIDGLSYNSKVEASTVHLSLKCSIPNPYDHDKEICLMFDTVLLLKSIRNNWFNQKDNLQTFVFPSFENPKITLRASVSDIKKLYYSENEHIVKLAPTLSKKVLYPTSFQRQNVSLAISLFNDKNIIALKHATTLQKKGQSFQGTMEFLSVITKWWKIVNVKHPYKGRNLRDPFCDPIRNVDVESICFLNKMLEWLESWSSVQIPGCTSSQRFGKLTKETQDALVHTTKSLVELCAHFFSVYKPKYILLGKFQTDNLESRFGRYRQMSGGNYNISVTQIFESEKKLKLLSLIKLYSSMSGEFSLKSFLLDCAPSASEDRIDSTIEELFDNVIELSNDVTVSENDKLVLIFMGGYVSYSVGKSLKCHQCEQCLTWDKEIDLSNVDVYKYLSDSSRGGLKWPTDAVINVTIAVFQIFQILLTAEFEEKLLRSKSQRQILKTLSFERCELLCFDWEGSCSCGRSLKEIEKKCISVLCNIFLNNYCKIKNDAVLEAKATKNATKKRKLSTLSKPGSRKK